MTGRISSTSPKLILSVTWPAFAQKNFVSKSKHCFQTATRYQKPHTSPRRSFTSTASSKMAEKIEEAKRAAAIEAVQNHFPSNPRFVGIGSGTTIVHVVNVIKEFAASGKTAPDGKQYNISQTRFVPTGSQSRQVVTNAGLTPIEFDALPDDAVLDIAFDGADEVDDDLNCIKGGGACLYQEKLVAMRANEFVCVADYRKLQKRLLTNWPTIPIEVEPLAVRQVLHSLRVLGSGEPFIRQIKGENAGPLRTDQNFFIVDAPFPSSLLLPADISTTQQGQGENGQWEVLTLAKAIKDINGVLGVGLFCGPTGPQAKATGVLGGQKPVACYFGMADGSVSVRKANEN